MKIVVSVNVLPNYISLLIVSSLKSAIFIALPFVFSRSYIACRSTQNAALIKRFLRLHIVIKPLIKNKHNKSFIMWKRNSFKISLQIWRLSKVSRDRLAVYLILEIFWTVSLKVNACFDGPELNECNLSWKIVNYCILYEVCMIKTAPHRTLSPQM